MASTDDDTGEFPLLDRPSETPRRPPPTPPEDPQPTPAGITQHTPTGSRERLVPRKKVSSAPQPDPNVPTSGKRLITRKVYLSPLEWLLHLGSIIFTISVLYLCGAKVYFLDITEPNINTILNLFQFVAALHGIIISISLGAVALYHLKSQLCAADGLPYGYVPETFQLGSLKMIFKPRFWRTLFTKANTPRTRLFGVGIVILNAILTLVPPSSAILLVPQLRWWEVVHPFGPAEAFSYLNGSHSLMWPHSIDGSMAVKECNGEQLFDIPKYCPYANVVAITDWGKQYINQFASPNITASTNANMLRYIGGSDSNPECGYSAVTSGMNHITQALGDIWRFVTRHPQVPIRHYGRPKITVSSQDYNQPIMRPLVQTQCGPPQDITQVDEIYGVSFPVDQIIPSSGQNFISPSKEVNIKISQTLSPAVNFVDLSEEAGMPLLGALIGMSFTNAIGLNFNRSDASGLMACTIAPYWIPTNMSTDPNVDNVAILDNANPLDIVNSTELMGRAVPIGLNLSYANQINPRLQTLGVNVLEYEHRPLAFNKTARHLYDGSWGKSWSWVGATLLAMQLSDALARLNSTMPMMTYCELCANQTIDPGYSTLLNLTMLNRDPEHPVPKYKQSTKEFADEIKKQSNLYMPVQWKAQRYGYGWGLSSETEWLAATVLLLHTLLVLAHLLVVFIQRRHFEGWNELASFVAFANNSPGLKKLEGLALGEADDEAYAATVMVRASKDGKYAIFTSNDRANGLKQLEPGKDYSINCK